MRRDVGAVVGTYHRVLDACGGMETIRSVWAESVGRTTVVHAYNGEREWYPAPTLEDQLVRVTTAAPHFRGAGALIDAGFAQLRSAHPECRYGVFVTADAWVLNGAWLRDLIDEMANFGLRLCSADWRIDSGAHGVARSTGSRLLPNSGLATDFFVVDVPWAFRWGLLPLRYGSFLDANADVLNYLQEMPFLERYLAGRYLGAVRAELATAGGGKDPWGSEGPRRARDLLRIMHERPIDPLGVPSHKDYWPEIGLVTSEDPLRKQFALREYPRATGPLVDRLRREADVDWFRPAGGEPGVTRGAIK